MRGNVDSEGASREAAPAMGALRGMMRQGIVLSLEFRGEAVAFGLVEELVDFGDRDALRAW